MKIACLISGQLRAVDPILINKGLHLFCHGHDVDFYIDIWDFFGVSMAHNPERLTQRTEGRNEIVPYLEKITKGLRINDIRIYSYESWKEQLSGSYRGLHSELSSTLYRHMLPQLFLMQQSFARLSSPGLYNVVARLRPDNLFVLPFIEAVPPNEIRTINFGRHGSYYPNRIYDIFFAMHGASAIEYSKIWDEIFENISLESGCTLKKPDACRILYNHAIRHGLSAETFRYRYTDVFRGDFQEYIADLDRWGLIASPPVASAQFYEHLEKPLNISDFNKISTS
jgi:hypothetical protein